MRQGQNLRQTDFLKFWFRHFINFGFDPKALTSQKLSRAKAPGSSRRPGGGFGPTSEQCAENISIRRTLSCGYARALGRVQPTGWTPTRPTKSPSGKLRGITRD